MCSIYGLKCLETGELYIGSTSNFYMRKAQHKGMYGCCSSKQIISRGNYEFYIIELVDKNIRYEREAYHIKNTNCINKTHKIPRPPNPKMDIPKMDIPKMEPENITCYCGKILQRKNMLQHSKTQHHKQYKLQVFT